MVLSCILNHLTCSQLGFPRIPTCCALILLLTLKYVWWEVKGRGIRGLLQPRRAKDGPKCPLGSTECGPHCWCPAHSPLALTSMVRILTASTCCRIKPSCTLPNVHDKWEVLQSKLPCLPRSPQTGITLIHVLYWVPEPRSGIKLQFPQG